MNTKNDILWDAIRKHVEELDKHLLGAWMAGYEAVDVLHDNTQIQKLQSPPKDLEFTLSAKVKLWPVYPTNEYGKELNPYDERYDIKRYDLRDLEPELVRELRRGGK